MIRGSEGAGERRWPAVSKLLLVSMPQSGELLRWQRVLRWQRMLVLKWILAGWVYWLPQLQWGREHHRARSGREMVP